MNHVGFVAGLASGFWYVDVPGFQGYATHVNYSRVGYAMTFWTNERGQQDGWRFSLAASFIPAVIFLVGLPFMHDS